jgi:hypothetical protein
VPAPLPQDTSISNNALVQETRKEGTALTPRGTILTAAAIVTQAPDLASQKLINGQVSGTAKVRREVIPFLGMRPEAHSGLCDAPTNQGRENQRCWRKELTCDGGEVVRWPLPPALLTPTK